MTSVRKIIHIDMDAFFASVEQRDNPDLRGKPIAVGGSSERGVVAAASYEARKFGVKSAMPSAIAARQCPNLIFVKHRFDVYKDVSRQIRQIFLEYTDLVEPLSLDEAYLDVTENKMQMKSATLIARQIKARIKAETELTASAGVSYNKFLAKTASDMDKPDGLYVILPEDADEFLRKLPVSRFFGIGKATAEKMTKAGIYTGGDLRKKSLEDMKLRFGKAGPYYYNICRGIDERAVKPDRERKSVSAENTFSKDLMSLDAVHKQLKQLTKVVFERYEKVGKQGKTITIKVKYSDFQQITRSHTRNEPITSKEAFDQEVFNLADESILSEKGIRLLGVGVSNFVKDEVVLLSQLTLRF